MSQPRSIGKYGKLTPYEKAFVQQACQIDLISDESCVIAWESGVQDSNPSPALVNVVNKVNNFFSTFPNYVPCPMYDIEAVMVVTPSEYPIMEKSVCQVHHDESMIVIDGWYLSHFVVFKGDPHQKFEQFLSKFRSFIYVNPDQYPDLLHTFIQKYSEQLNPLVRCRWQHHRDECMHHGANSTSYQLGWLKSENPLNHFINDEYQKWIQYVLEQYGCGKYPWWYVKSSNNDIFSWFG
jgi:hypothetical protein